MSRIYDNQPLRNLPAINVNYPAVWNTDQFSRGDGVLFEGIIKTRSHFVVTDSQKAKKHYYIFFIQLLRAHKRKFGPGGEEIEPNFSETKKVSTGFLNSSYKTEAKGVTDRLSEDAARTLIEKSDLTAHTRKYESRDQLALWMDADQCAGLEFENGDSVRVKTRGDGPFLFNIVKIDDQSSTVANYAGGAGVGASWTDKIMDMKSSASTTDDNIGVDDDEWTY